MSKSKFSFLNKSKDDKSSSPELKQIQKLREQAKKCRDENNILTTQIWDINQKLAKTENETDKKPLLDTRKKLEDAINKAGYEKKYQSLLENIKTLEIKVNGYSDLDNSTFDL